MTLAHFKCYSLTQAFNFCSLLQWFSVNKNKTVDSYCLLVPGLTVTRTTLGLLRSNFSDCYLVTIWQHDTKSILDRLHLSSELCQMLTLSSSSMAITFILVPMQKTKELYQTQKNPHQFVLTLQSFCLTRSHHNANFAKEPIMSAIGHKML